MTLFDRMAAEYATSFSTEDRKRLAQEGVARPDGSYPIRNGEDLSHALNDYARTGAPADVRTWIIHRARALGLTKALPMNWGIAGAR